MHSYNVLLHLCAGGNQPDDAPKRLYPAHASEVVPLLPRHFKTLTGKPLSFQVYEYMISTNVQAVEMTYTALARVNAGSDPVKAYQVVRLKKVPLFRASLNRPHIFQTKDMRAAGVMPRLRTFSPALTGFCDAGDLDNVCSLFCYTEVLIALPI